MTACAASVLAAVPARAERPASPADAPKDGAPAEPDPGLLTGLSELVEIHGFVSQGFIKTTGTNYLVQSSNRGSFELNEVGLNLTRNVTDRLRVGLQFFTRTVGSAGTYVPTVDWFYLDYHFQDWLGFRAGRTKLPFGLYNEVNDIDAARVPVLLPQAMYPLLERDILLAQTGVEAYGYVGLGALGALDYRLYGGTLHVDPGAPAPPLQLVRFDVPYLVGGRILWETPIQGLRAGGSLQAARFNADFTAPAPGGGTAPISLQLPYLLAVASIEYAAHDLVLSVEYGRWRTEVDTNIAPSRRTVSERAYAMASYQLRPWLTPSLYYSVLVPDIAHREGQANHQYDLAGTVRVDLNAHWLLKLEGHYLQGTADVRSALNGGRAVAALANDWFMILAKTTVSF